MLCRCSLGALAPLVSRRSLLSSAVAARPAFKRGFGARGFASHEDPEEARPFTDAVDRDSSYRPQGSRPKRGPIKSKKKSLDELIDMIEGDFQRKIAKPKKLDHRLVKFKKKQKAKKDENIVSIPGVAEFPESDLATLPPEIAQLVKKNQARNAKTVSPGKHTPSSDDLKPRGKRSVFNPSSVTKQLNRVTTVTKFERILVEKGRFFTKNNIQAAWAKIAEPGFNTPKLQHSSGMIELIGVTVRKIEKMDNQGFANIMLQLSRVTVHFDDAMVEIFQRELTKRINTLKVMDVGMITDVIIKQKVPLNEKLEKGFDRLFKYSMKTSTTSTYKWLVRNMVDMGLPITDELEKAVTRRFKVDWTKYNEIDLAHVITSIYWGDMVVWKELADQIKPMYVYNKRVTKLLDNIHLENRSETTEEGPIGTTPVKGFKGEEQTMQKRENELNEAEMEKVSTPHRYHLEFQTAHLKNNGESDEVKSNGETDKESTVDGTCKYRLYFQTAHLR